MVARHNGPACACLMLGEYSKGPIVETVAKKAAYRVQLSPWGMWI